MRSLLLVLLLLVPSVSLAQTPVACEGSRTLSWNTNTESDMKEYKVYEAPTPSGMYSEIAIVPHDPLDTKTTYALGTELEEREYYYYVTALDQNGNESPESNTVSCVYDVAPQAPSELNLILAEIAKALTMIAQTLAEK